MKRNRFLRAAVLVRDGGLCKKCGRFDPRWQCDHITDLQFGGTDTLDNLQTLCRRHHTEKTTAAAPRRAKADRLRERHETMLARRAIN
jgi:5-methylcytosine-specific restriction endonuclease McrA